MTNTRPTPTASSATPAATIGIVELLPVCGSVPSDETALVGGVVVGAALVLGASVVVGASLVGGAEDDELVVGASVVGGADELVVGATVVVVVSCEVGGVSGAGQK